MSSSESNLRSAAQATPYPSVPKKWACGMTTVSERRSSGLLLRSLASLRAAGFDDVRLFVDGPSLEETCGCEATFRTGPRLRTVGNWFLAAFELLVRNPVAERFAVFQDDLTASKNIRQYLDAIAWPDMAYLNLYTCRKNEKVIHGKPPGFILGASLESDSYPSDWQRGLGALALCFTRNALITLIQHPHTCRKITDIGLDTQGGENGQPRTYSDGSKRLMGQVRVDGAIVTAMNLSGWHEWVHAPSLVQHTGDQSSMGNGRHPPAESFRGEDFDCLSLLK